ncbi:uncharacterized protein LOC115763033 [Drosophila novamexicana]|uniref:uncharacterized protein LOC115763033 n=1 Tax=Drosophila novamexicana TaxID=47314 RepID=UPI0011E5C231|nr:uncharacterized protein LOC115763033 [Drosophila novamexicana]
MQPYCKYNDKSKRCVTWFNQVCADCRSQFPSSGVNQRLKEGGQKSKVGLISAEECYRSIKRSTELLATDGYDKDEVWWKVPLILLVLGCILVFSIVTCLVCQKVVKTVQERMSQHVDFNVCESKKKRNVCRRRKRPPPPQRTSSCDDRKLSSKCSCAPKSIISQPASRCN